MNAHLIEAQDLGPEPRHLGRLGRIVLREVPDEQIGIDRDHAETRRAAPSAAARLISSAVPIFPLVLPASAPRLEPVSGAARRNDTSPGRLNTNTTRSPALTPSFRRTATGIVT